MKKFILCLICMLSIFAISLNAAEKTDPWVEWRRGYELFLEGDKHMRRNELEQALNAYKRSRDTYRKVLNANTGWNKNLINSKISACETQILKIEKKLGTAAKSAPASPAPESAAPISRPARTDSEESRGDDDYKRKYFNLYIEVENLRKQLRSQSQAVKNIDDLLREKRIAEEKVLTLQRSLENLRKQMAEPERELQSLRKQLIAERLKSEQLANARASNEKQIETLQLTIKKLNEDITSFENKLRESSAAARSMEDTISDLKNKLDELTSKRNSLASELQSSLDRIKSLNQAYEKAQNEIKKLNAWIDELNQKKGTTEKISDNIVSENRELKTQNTALLNKIRELEQKISDITSKLQKAMHDYQVAAQNLNAVNTRKTSIENELRQVRELYVRQINTERTNKAELETLRAEQKKNTESLQVYIRRVADLSANLETKESAISGYAAKIDALQRELAAKEKEIKTLNTLIASSNPSLSAKKISDLTKNCEKLQTANTSLLREIRELKSGREALEAEIRSLKNELAIFRTEVPAAGKNATASAGAAPESNQNYQRLLAAYNDLKKRYDFLSLEIESLNKPLADVEENTPEITSEGELAKFLLKSANDAIAANDYISAAWYFSELKKQDGKNKFYIYGFALFNTIASERDNAAKTIEELGNTRERFILSGVLALLNGKKDEASANIKKAAETASAGAEIAAFYNKELPAIIKMFEKTESLRADIEALKNLLK